MVVILALHGLLPGFPVEPAAAGVPGRAEPAVTAASAPGDDHSCPEHACGVTLHLCSCCVSQPVLVPAVAPLPRELAQGPHARLGAERLLAHRGPDRPFRPPIG
jgi:hypothetical protein